MDDLDWQKQYLTRINELQETLMKYLIMLIETQDREADLRKKLLETEFYVRMENVPDKLK